MVVKFLSEAEKKKKNSTVFFPSSLLLLLSHAVTCGQQSVIRALCDRRGVLCS